MELQLVEQIDTGINVEALEEWKEYREFKKKPLSPLALKKSQNFLLRYAHDVQQFLVDKAVMNDWQGLHHVEPPKQNTSRQQSLKDDLTDKSWAT